MEETVAKMPLSPKGGNGEDISGVVFFTLVGVPPTGMQHPGEVIGETL